MWFRGSALGLLLVDRFDDSIGRIDGTWPLDGGGEPEFAIVRVGRFGETRLIPLRNAQVVDGLLQVPYSRGEVEMSPTLDTGRYLREQVEDARAYWSLGSDYERLGYERILRTAR